MKRTKDLLWLLAIPVYLLINYLRHESAHALADWLQGMQGSLFFLPRLTLDGLLTGSQVWDTNVSWMTLAMPFLSDLGTFLIFFYICMAVPFRTRWLWINLVIVGLVLPLVNSGWHFFGNTMNVRALTQLLPAKSVNLYFTGTLGFYLIGILLVIFFSRTTLPTPSGEPVVMG